MQDNMPIAAQAAISLRSVRQALSALAREAGQDPEENATDLCHAWRKLGWTIHFLWKHCREANLLPAELGAIPDTHEADDEVIAWLYRTNRLCRYEALQRAFGKPAANEPESVCVDSVLSQAAAKLVLARGVNVMLNSYDDGDGRSVSLSVTRPKAAPAKGEESRG